MILHKITRTEATGDVPDFMFFCPGCECTHGIWTTHANGRGGVWKFNGDMEKPTFGPSILVMYEEGYPPVTPENLDEYRKKPWAQTKKKSVCHSFVRDGQIQFLSDCTHKLAGQTVPLPKF